MGVIVHLLRELPDTFEMTGQKNHTRKHTQSYSAHLTHNRDGSRVRVCAASEQTVFILITKGKRCSVIP